MHNFEPFNDFVVVEPFSEASSTTETYGLAQVDAGKEKPQEGRVLAVPLDMTRPSVGDHVFYQKFGGTELVIEGQKVRLLRQSEILGRLNDNPQQGENLG